MSGLEVGSFHSLEKVRTILSGMEFRLQDESCAEAKKRSRPVAEGGMPIEHRLPDGFQSGISFAPRNEDGETYAQKFEAGVNGTTVSFEYTGESVGYRC